MGVLYSLYNRALRFVSTAVGDPIQYAADGLYSTHSVDFINDSRFASAYATAMATPHGHGPDLHIEWRVYVCCWAAAQAIQLPGDFVECGVNAGIYSSAICKYVDFSNQRRRMYLLDTFQGMPADQFSEREREHGFVERYVYGDAFEAARRTFSNYSNVELVRGRVPETLGRVTSESIAYLSIDMNAAAPEIAAIEYFWPRLVAGAIVVLDDYAWRLHVEQKAAFDGFARSHNANILSLPTGQGLLVKSP